MKKYNLHTERTRSGSNLLAKLFPFLLALCALAPSARAQEEKSAMNGGAGLVFELGAIGTVAPSYEGSDRFVVYPFPVARFHFLRLNNGFEMGGSDEGLSIYPSLLYRAKRSASNDIALVGLNDVAQALELGAGISYQLKYVRAFVDLRYGAVGHKGVVGETGIDGIVRPTPKLTLSAGPRLSFASVNYMDAYFGVTPAEAAASGLAATGVSSGFKSAGVGGNVRYEFTDVWALEGLASWNRLIGDAASSPVTTLGNKNQFSIGLGFTRKFTVNF